MVRNAVVAGQFYSGTKNSLFRDVDSLIDSKAKKIDAIGVVSPHAGYMYSGSVAGAVYSSIKPKSTYIILGPNHTGIGKRFGIDTSDSWRTPLGDVMIDRSLANKIKERSGLIEDDSLCHMHEHSIEVQIPFLQVLQKDFKIVPLVVSYATLGECRQIAGAIAQAVVEAKLQEQAAIIASSDMTHYEPDEAAKKKDSKAIESILALDEEGLLECVAALDITMCGVMPAAIMIKAAKELGAKSARLVRYKTSADASGDYSSVVGYAGIIIE